MAQRDGQLAHDAWRLAQPQHHGHDGHRDHAVDHGAPDQRFDGVDLQHAQNRAKACGGNDQPVKTACFMKAVREAGLPAQHLAHRIGGRARQHWYGQQPCADDAQRKHRKSQVACDGAQCFGGLCGGLNFGNAIQIQRDGGGHHNAQRHAVGQQHAHSRVQPDAGQMLLHIGGEFAQRSGVGAQALVFHFLRGLPEEKIGADGGAQHGHHHGGIVAQRSVGRHEAPGLQGLHRHLLEGHMHHHHHGEIGEQRQRQPFEQPHRAFIREKHLSQQAHCAKQQAE